MNFWSGVLVVDDEKNTREGLARFLTGLDYDVFSAESGKEALDLFKKEQPELVLTDLKMPDMDGIELLHQIKKIRPETIIIILTAYGTVENAVQAMKAGAYYYLTKPIHFDELELILKKAITQRSLEQENVKLRQELIQERHEGGHIIGESPAYQNMIAMAKQVAKSDAAVLIQGESGTGKELIAHLIHAESKRAAQPFVTVHIAALTETLLASELFGHEKGAFTGAAERKIGRFERSDGGTLFLDEVAEIPESMQTKLLRVLQSGEFERVGSSKTMRANVRLICATNKNLREEVTKGKFREDLFYRINVILLSMPPLRERTEDIPLLARHYLKYFSQRERKTITRISPDAIRLLKEYHWPGNIRELKNIMERMVVLASSDTIDVNQLPDDIRKRNGSGLRQPSPCTAGRESTIKTMEETMIRRALSEAGHNKSIAAKRLGISRRTLYRKLTEYRISE